MHEANVLRMSDQPKPAQPPAPRNSADPAAPEPKPERPAAPAKPPVVQEIPAPAKSSAVHDAAAAQSVTVFIPPHGLPKPPPAPLGPMATPAMPVAAASPPPTTKTAIATRSAPAAPPPPASEPAASFASSLNAKPVPSAAAGQAKCSTCGHSNRAGVLICENCGTALIPAASATILGTQKLDKSSTEAAAAEARITPADSRSLSSSGPEQFDETMILRLEIEGAGTPILVYPHEETSLGRRDPAGGTIPDVDLTSYAAYRMGVSRRHALLKLKDARLHLVDLGSSNGTMLNGVRLAPHQPRPIRDGDTITLGKMSLRAVFQSSAKR